MLGAILGGVLIGGSAGLLLLGRGRIAGVGGMVGGLIAQRAGGVAGRDVEHRAAFLLGLVIVGLFAAALHAPTLGPARVPLAAVAIGGLLVGWGVQRGSGCTSGHGVCGVARLSLRSVVATVTFMTTGALAVFVARHLWSIR